MYSVQPQIPGQRPRCGESYTTGGQNNAFSAFKCQKIALEGCKKRPPKLSGSKIRNNRGAREAETSDKSQNLRDKNSWRKNIRVGEEKREATGKLCKKINSRGTRDRERWKEGKRRTRRVELNVRGRAMRSTEWPEEPPNLSCTKIQVSWDNLESCKDKEREGTTVGLASDPVKCRARWTLEAEIETTLKSCLRAEIIKRVRSHTLGFPGLNKNLAVCEDINQKFEMLSENESRTFESARTSSALISRWRWEGQ